MHLSRHSLLHKCKRRRRNTWARARVCTDGATPQVRRPIETADNLRIRELDLRHQDAVPVPVSHRVLTRAPRANIAEAQVRLPALTSRTAQEVATASRLLLRRLHSDPAMRLILRVNTHGVRRLPCHALYRPSPSSGSKIDLRAPEEWSCSCRTAMATCMVAIARGDGIQADRRRTMERLEARVTDPEAGLWQSLTLDDKSAGMDVLSCTLVS